MNAGSGRRPQTVILLDDLLTQLRTGAHLVRKLLRQAYHRWMIAFGTRKRNHNRACSLRVQREAWAFYE